MLDSFFLELYGRGPIILLTVSAIEELCKALIGPVLP